MEIVRLLDDDTEPAARALLRQGLDAHPPEGALDRALSGLGLVSVAAGAAGGALGASTAGTGSGSLVSVASIAKSIVVGAVVGTLATTGALHVMSPRTPVPAPATPAAARVAPPGHVPARARTTTLVTARPDAPRAQHPRIAHRPRLPPARLAAPSASVSASAPAASAAAFPLSPEDRLKAEVALLDRVRAALARGDNREALLLLARHQRQYPSGALAPEAFVLELTSLVRAGRGDAARAEARAWLATHPDGDYANRIRKIVAE